MLTLCFHSQYTCPSSQEKKKVQNIAVVQQEMPFGTRPGTSSRRLSDRSLNGGFSNAMPLNRRVSLGIQQFGTNTINSASQSISFMKEAKKLHGHKTFLRPEFASNFRDETASVVSTFSGPISP